MKQKMNLFLAPVLLALLVAIPIASAFISGCSTNSQNIAAKSEGVIIPSVNGAMFAWADYVKGTNGVTQAQADSVKSAYLKYYDSQIIASNAFVNFFSASSGVDTNAAAIAKANLDAAIKTAADSQASILSLLNSLMNRK